MNPKTTCPWQTTIREVTTDVATQARHEPSQAGRQLSLLAAYDGIVCDLDGVVYRGAAGIGDAIEALNTVLTEQDPQLVFATNNASRSAQVVADQLISLGLPVTAAQVATSAQAGAAYLRRELGVGARVLAVGGEGVAVALTQQNLHAVRPSELAPPDTVVGVLQGWGWEVSLRDLAAACGAIADGAVWVATNTDLTLPVEGGFIPGNGTLVGAVATASGTEPIVVGKPHAPLYEHAAEVLGIPAARALAIGDRLDTDIAGAAAAGMDSVWVLTGVHGFRELARSSTVPTVALASLSGLHHPRIDVCRDGDTWRAGPVDITLQDDSTVVVSQAESGADLLLWANAVAAVGLAVVLFLRGDGADSSDAVACDDSELTTIAAAFDSALQEAQAPREQ